jgi:predicted DNA-binding transcriptional regulator AlpA
MSDATQHPAHLAARRLFRTPDAARYLALAESTLEKSRLTGTGPRFSRLGRAVVYELRDLDEWVEERKAARASGTDAR